jgi:hypothetical protein
MYKIRNGRQLRDGPETSDTYAGRKNKGVQVEQPKEISRQIGKKVYNTFIKRQDIKDDSKKLGT